MRSYVTKYFIGFSYGISFPLTLVLLDYRLKDLGLSNASIAIFTLLHILFMMKFLWGTFIYHFKIPFLSEKLGINRSWILISHILLMIGVIGMACANSKSDIMLLAFSACLVSFSDGCKNILLYPYQIDGVQEQNIGHIANIVGLGHRIGTILIKVTTLYIAHFYGWKIAYLSSLAPISILMMIVLSIDEPKIEIKSNLHFKQTFNENILKPLTQIIKKRNGISSIFIIMFYKTSDFLIQKMSRSFCVDVGFSKLEIANVIQFYGSITVIIGGFIGGFLIKRIGIIKTMILASSLHAASFVLYLLLMTYGAKINILSILISAEGITGGCVTAAFIAFLYSICSTGTVYALLWAFHEISSMFFMTLSGILADLLGWTAYFSIVPFFSIPGILLLRKIYNSQQQYA